MSKSLGSSAVDEVEDEDGRREDGYTAADDVGWREDSPLVGADTVARLMESGECRLVDEE